MPKQQTHGGKPVRGEFLDTAGERYYAIRNVDQLPPFFISVVSNSDHWLFASSSGGLTAGRVTPETALFPYVTSDKIHESPPHTGPVTLIRVDHDGSDLWSPFEDERPASGNIRRNLYKNLLGNKLCYEEIHDGLQLAFRYTWQTSEEFGFVRDCELQNLGNASRRVEFIDGLRNVLPAGTPRYAQANSSNLVDAYKWAELHEASGVGLFTLFSGITDRAEPAESLRASTVFALGLEDAEILLSTAQLNAFRDGDPVRTETNQRGVRGAFLLQATREIAPGQAIKWRVLAEVEQTQADVVALTHKLRDRAAVGDAVSASIDAGSDELARIMAGADGFQTTAEENVTVHHYANVLFNVLRGGIFDDHYAIMPWDFLCTLEEFNRDLFARHREFLNSLPHKVDAAEFRARLAERNDAQLDRLALEYLPIRFGRRHGDPSRPWNEFAIRLQDENGYRLLSYQGNWRDIFQNWEALTFSYPEFIESVIAKFVNASTVDGYNPYRITKEGIDWEVEEVDDPWSYIGYWGDHQIIYLLKLLELSRRFHPERLRGMLRTKRFSYANVPYRIKAFEEMLRTPKHTVSFDDALAEEIESRVARTGADGKLVWGPDREVQLVGLWEKLLVPMLSKLGNLVLDGGIWMNTQRPEWNDANNALVGQGLSMVTLYYLRRYVAFLRDLLDDDPGAARGLELSGDVRTWLAETADVLRRARPMAANGVAAPERHAVLADLGAAASRHRSAVYAREHLSDASAVPTEDVRHLFDDALALIDASTQANRRPDGLYHAYNLLVSEGDELRVDHLYAMLEGQVAALSAGTLSPAEAADVVDALFASDVYRADQKSFMLYPDRTLPNFLEKNRIPPDAADRIPVLSRMLDRGDERILSRDGDGTLRFHPSFANVAFLNRGLEAAIPDYGDELAGAVAAIRDLYEEVFRHQEFTGRSGGMFMYEGLGSIYWHMVSKLMLAVQENYFAALETGADAATVRRLGDQYYRVREGIGFNKTPSEYGAFPTDPYSHTPKHTGAQQPGMTGQVKEEILTRFGELGIRVDGGVARFAPTLLRAREFSAAPSELRYLDVAGEWRTQAVPADALAFTWCQVPFVYERDASATEVVVTVSRADGSTESADRALSAADSAALFGRSGTLRGVHVRVPSDQLY